MPEPVDLGNDRPPRGEPRRPRRRTESKSKSTPSTPIPETEPRKRTPADKKLAAQIAGLYQMAGATIAGVGMRTGDEGITAAGVQTITISEPLADAWLDLADANPSVKRVLKKLTEASAAGIVVSLHITILVPVLISRGILPEQFAVAFAEQNGNGNVTDN